MVELAKIKDCVGCTACMNICPKDCIEMKKNEDGFVYPELVRFSECINCGSCMKVCPVLEIDSNKRGLPEAYAVISNNEMIRMESSSGGVFSEIATRFLGENGIVYGAAYDENFRVKHICVDSEDDLWKLRGAKYAESNLGECYRNILKDIKIGKKILFSGTPCQVAGLKKYIKKDYDNLFCIDFICHGIPSPMVWKEYIKYISKKDKSGELPIRINLRSKLTGWTKYQYSHLFEYENGNMNIIANSKSLFMKLFIGDYISRLCCENCKFKGYSRVSDITLGDFWGIWDIQPDMDDNKGTSVVLIQTPKGQSIFDEINTNVRFEKMSPEQVSQYNPSILKSSISHPKRNKVLKIIREGNIDRCEKMFEQSSILTKLKKIVNSRLHCI